MTEAQVAELLSHTRAYVDAHKEHERGAADIVDIYWKEIDRTDLDACLTYLAARTTITDALLKGTKRYRSGTWYAGKVWLEDRRPKKDGDADTKLDLYQRWYRNPSAVSGTAVTENSCQYIVTSTIYDGMPTIIALPSAESGIFYRMSTPSLEKDTGAWSYVIQKWDRQEQTVAEYVSQQTAKSYTQEEKFIGVKDGSTTSIEVLAASASDGVIIEKDTTKNDDCTKSHVIRTKTPVATTLTVTTANPNDTEVAKTLENQEAAAVELIPTPTEGKIVNRSVQLNDFNKYDIVQKESTAVRSEKSTVVAGVMATETTTKIQHSNTVTNAADFAQITATVGQKIQRDIQRTEHGDYNISVNIVQRPATPVEDASTVNNHLTVDKLTRTEGAHPSTLVAEIPVPVQGKTIRRTFTRNDDGTINIEKQEQLEKPAASTEVVDGTALFPRTTVVKVNQVSAISDPNIDDGKPIAGVQLDANNSITDGKNYSGASSRVTPVAYWSSTSHGLDEYLNWPGTVKSKILKNPQSGEAKLYTTQTEYTLTFRNIAEASLPDVDAWTPVFSGNIKKLEVEMRHEVSNYKLHDGRVTILILEDDPMPFDDTSVVNNHLAIETLNRKENAKITDVATIVTPSQGIVIRRSFNRNDDGTVNIEKQQIQEVAAESASIVDGTVLFPRTTILKVNQPSVITEGAPTVGEQTDCNNSLTDGKNYTGATSVVNPVAYWSSTEHTVAGYTSWPCTGKSKIRKNKDTDATPLYITQREYTLQFRNVALGSLPDVDAWTPSMTGTIKRLEATMRYDITNHGLCDGYVNVSRGDEDADTESSNPNPFVEKVIEKQSFPSAVNGYRWRVVTITSELDWFTSYTNAMLAISGGLEGSKVDSVEGRYMSKKVNSIVADATWLETTLDAEAAP